MKTVNKVVIIDDNTIDCTRISTLLQEFFPQIARAEIFGQWNIGIARIRSLQPQLVILNEHLVKGLDIDLPKLCAALATDMILMTNYDDRDQYIPIPGINYVQKPIHSDDFVRIISHILSRKYGQQQTNNSEWAYPVARPFWGQPKIHIPTMSGFLLVRIEDVVRCEASGNYTILYFINQKEMLVSKSLGEYEKELWQFGFFRIHHKHMVNVNYIKEYHKGKSGGGYIMLHHCTEPLSVSLRKKGSFLHMLHTACGILGAMHLL